MTEMTRELITALLYPPRAPGSATKFMQKCLLSKRRPGCKAEPPGIYGVPDALRLPRKCRTRATEASRWTPVPEFPKSSRWCASTGSWFIDTSNASLIIYLITRATLNFKHNTRIESADFTKRMVQGKTRANRSLQPARRD